MSDINLVCIVMQENAPRLPGGSKSASINQTLQTTLPEEQHTEEEEEDTK